MNEYGEGSYRLKKNSHIHLCLETELHTKLKKQANDRYISLSELCRRKIRECSQLDRIEFMLKILINKK